MHGLSNRKYLRERDKRRQWVWVTYKLVIKKRRTRESSDPPTVKTIRIVRRSLDASFTSLSSYGLSICKIQKNKQIRKKNSKSDREIYLKDIIKGDDELFSHEANVSEKIEHSSRLDEQHEDGPQEYKPSGKKEKNIYKRDCREREAKRVREESRGLEEMGDECHTCAQSAR